MKLLYNITSHVDHEVVQDWQTFMHQSYIPTMMSSSYFESFKMLKILGDHSETGVTFAVQYVAKNLDAFAKYQAEIMPLLLLEQKTLFEDKCVSFKTLMEIVAE